MKKGKTILLMFVDVLLLIVLLGLIDRAFEFRRLVFYAEFILVFGLMIASFIALVAALNHMRWGYIMLSLIFLVSLGDFLLLYLLNRSPSILFGLGIIASLIGFIICVTSIGEKGDYLVEAKEEGIEEIEPKEKRKKGKQRSKH